MQLTLATELDGEPEANQRTPSNDMASVFPPIPPTSHFGEAVETPNSYTVFVEEYPLVCALA
jgi:hypothetical protein